MDISSVSSSLGAYTTPSQSGQVQQNAQTQQTAPVEKQEPKPEERVELREEAPKPFVNARGETTGTLLNVTA